MTTFALVHGAWHGGWCWQRLIPELAARGHRAVAMDLPPDDPQAGAEHYAASVVQALEGFDEDVVLVGHSLAGLIIPVVASLRPVRHPVYVCAILPSGRSLGRRGRRAAGIWTLPVRDPSGGQS